MSVTWLLVDPVFVYQSLWAAIEPAAHMLHSSLNGKSDFQLGKPEKLHQPGLQDGDSVVKP